MPDGFRIRTFALSSTGAQADDAQVNYHRRKSGLSETSCFFENRRGGRNTLSAAAA
jgi:hypothetical protein